MKSKRLNYILIPSVILIWGYVANSYFGIISWNSNQLPPSSSFSAITLEAELPDTFSLKLSYPDPFSLNPPKRRVAKQALSTNTINIGNIRRLEPPKIKPPLSYLGFINKEGSLRKMALVFDGRQTYQLAVGDSLAKGEIISIDAGILSLQMADTMWTYKRDDR